MDQIHGQRLKIGICPFLATQVLIIRYNPYHHITKFIPLQVRQPQFMVRVISMRGYLNKVQSRAAERVALSTVMSPKHLKITGDILVTPCQGHSGPGKSASLRLYSRTKVDPRTGKGKLTDKVCFKNGKSSGIDKGLKAIITYHVKITTETGFGVPGAFLLTNRDKHRFFLQSASFRVEGGQSINFDCRSWVYPARDTKSGIIFFSNTSYLPNQTPETLVELRKEELECLRGDGTGERKDGDRIYDYDYYNDLGNPDKGQEHQRPVLGGTGSHPYPRRLRTGRPRSKKDASTESRPEMINLDVFVPPYEQISPKKLPELLSNSQSMVHFLVSEAASLLREDLGTFSSFDEIRKLFSSNEGAPAESFAPNEVINKASDEQLKKAARARKQKTPKFPVPQIIAENEWAWKDDKEFARQMLAGTNPVRIELLQWFPPMSRTRALSSIRSAQLERNLDGLTVQQALDANRLFILDHHDYLLPFLAKMNMKDVRAYASRTLLFLGEDDILKPVVIELTLPRSSYSMDVNRVFLPASQGTEAALWQFAKAHVAANDSAYHHLISHWLHTHAVIEPFIIATRRQLSMMHPIHRLLDPHFKDTIRINALARSFLINSGGILETTLLTKNVSMELSSMLYKKWRFDEQALPSDLLKRGMAVEDPDNPAGVKLVLADYPYAADGLEIWTALKTWVRDFCSIFYKDDRYVRFDEELQAWWSEIRNVGHGDKKYEHWWNEMKTFSDLIETLTTIIWIASGLHASVSTGQYAYASYPPNRPAMCRQFIPLEGTFEFAEFLRDSDRYYLDMLPGRLEMTLMVAMTEVLSRHTSDEVYLGQRASSKWTDSEEIQQSFAAFNENLKQIQERILQRNKDPELKHRSGPAKIQYEVLIPNASSTEPEKEIPRKGIPNSISM